jgi:uncharacterized protein
MLIEQFRWLAGVVAAHHDRKVVGRTRLQKTIYLLQRKGLPSDFDYSLHFYGPYSRGLNTGLNQVRQFGLVSEAVKTGSDNDYYVFQASEDATLPQIEPFRPALEAIQSAEDVPVELAATYDAFREMGYPHPESLKKLRSKKGTKCTPENEAMAFSLLRQLELPVD